MCLADITIVIPSYLLFLLFGSPVWLYLVSKRSLSRNVVLSITFTSAIFAYSTLYFLLRLISMPIGVANALMWLIPSLLTVILLFFSIKNDSCRSIRTFFSISIDRHLMILLLLFLGYGFLLMNYLLRNGMDSSGDLVLFNHFANEGLWHANIMAGLRENIIPTTLHYVATDNFNYHFFPDLYVQMFASMTNDAPFIILFTHFFVPVMLLALGINIYTLTLLLWNRKAIAILAVVTSFYCYDLSALILWIRGVIVDHDWFFGKTYPTILSAWSPLVSQFQIFHNPSYLYSSALFTGLVVASHTFSEKKERFFLMIAAIGWAMLIKAKITAYLVALVVVPSYGLMRWRFKGDSAWIKISIGMIILSLPFLIPSLGQPKNSAEFSNWYFPANFAVRANLISAEARYEINENGFPLESLEQLKFVLSFFLFYAGLLNFRLIAIWRRFSSSFHFIKNCSLNIFMICVIAVSLIAFVLICNGLSKYDSMWFYLLGLFFINMYTAERIYSLWNIENRLATVGKFLIVFLMAWTSITFLIPALRPDTKSEYKLTITRSELDAYAAIQKDAGSGRVLTKYYHLNESTRDERNQLAGAFSGKPIISEGLDYIFEYRAKNQSYIENVAAVRKETERIYQTSDRLEAEQIVSKYHIGYILLKNNEHLNFDSSGLLETMFCESGITVYRIIPK